MWNSSFTPFDWDIYSRGFASAFPPIYLSLPLGAFNMQILQFEQQTAWTLNSPDLQQIERRSSFFSSLFDYKLSFKVIAGVIDPLMANWGARIEPGREQSICICDAIESMNNASHFLVGRCSNRLAVRSLESLDQSPSWWALLLHGQRLINTWLAVFFVCDEQLLLLAISNSNLTLSP